MFYSLSFLFKTGCIDPGILPRGHPDELEYMQALGDVGKAIQIGSCCVLGGTDG